MLAPTGGTFQHLVIDSWQNKQTVVDLQVLSLVEFESRMSAIGCLDAIAVQVPTLQTAITTATDTDTDRHCNRNCNRNCARTLACTHAHMHTHTHTPARPPAHAGTDKMSGGDLQLCVNRGTVLTSIGMPAADVPGTVTG